MPSLNDIGREAHEINAGNGWEVFKKEDFPSPSDTPDQQQAKVRFLLTHVALIHSEASEALEAVRHRDFFNFSEELADVVIRCLSVAHGLNIDMESTINHKLIKNRARGLHHGGKAV